MKLWGKKMFCTLRICLSAYLSKFLTKYSINGVSFYLFYCSNPVCAELVYMLVS